MPEVGVPAVALVQPVAEPVVGLGGRDEVLQLHLFELPGPEDEVLGGDLVAEGLAHLGDAERRALPRGLDHIGEVDERALGRLRSEVGDGPLVLDRAGVGLEHEVEGPGLGELGRTARRAHPVDLVLAPPLVAVAAVDQRVGEVGQVARGVPHRRGRQDGGIQAHHVVTALHHRLPPGVLDIAQHVDAERPEVVGRPEAPVDLRRLEDEAAALAQPDHLVHEAGGRVRGGHGVRHREEAYRLPPTRPSPARAGPSPGWPPAGPAR